MLTVAEADRLLTAPGQPFEVTENSIRGIATKTWRNAPKTLADIVRNSRGYGDAVFLVYEDERMTFEEHYRAVGALSHALIDRFDVRPGDRVAIAMRNFPEWSVAFWAVAATGAIVVPLNAWWSGEELTYGLSDSGTKVLIADESRARALEAHRGELTSLDAVIVVRSGSSPSRSDHFAYEEIVDAASPSGELPEVVIGTDDDATIFYTSGTTGSPKGALGTHRNICTNPMSLIYVTTRQAYRAGINALEGAPQPSYLLSVPLFHATGCHTVLVGNAVIGGKITMMHRWDPRRALELIERESVGTFGGVPAMAMQVLDHPDFDRFDTSSVRSVGYGGAPAPADLVRRIKLHFPDGGASNGYGLTETSSLSTMNQGDDYVERPASVGPPVPVVEVRVVNPDGDDVDAGARGELWIKGPNVVKGYWNKPEATAASFSHGWLHTGDVARLDPDGFVTIVDRAKDMLIRGGENVYCVEIESVLHDHPAVADAAIIGIPHPLWGEEVGAVVQRRAGMSVGEGELQDHVRLHLAGFKVPVRVWFVDEPLPRNPAGKILKRQLREDYAGSAG